MSKITDILGNEYLGYVSGNFARESIRHPYLMGKELYRFLSHWLLGTTERPKEGLRFENHSHSHYSDGDELGYIVDYLFDEGIYIWSLTDHDTSDGFDDLASGRYDLNENTESERKYDIDVNLDGRSMVIRSGSQELVLLRSIEKMTDKGEIGIHGYSGDLPYKEMSVDETIKRAIMPGAFVVINHPDFWSGIGYHGEDVIREAIKVAREYNGVIAIEKNGTEIPPQSYSPMRADLLARKLNIPLVCSGDAHGLYMYGKSGIVFDEEEYREVLKENDGNHADAVKELIRRREFDTYFNYLTPEEFLNFFQF